MEQAAEKQGSARLFAAFKKNFNTINDLGIKGCDPVAAQSRQIINENKSK